MAMTATLAMVGNPIVNAPINFILTVSNSAGAIVNVTGIQPFVTPVGTPMRLSDIFAAPGFSLASTTGGINALKVAIPAGGSTTFSFQGLMMSGGLPTGAPAQASTLCAVGCNVISDDGSVFGPQPLTLAPAQPTPGLAEEFPFSTNDYGSLQFSVPFNSALIF